MVTFKLTKSLYYWLSFIGIHKYTTNSVRSPTRKVRGNFVGIGNYLDAPISCKCIIMLKWADNTVYTVSSIH